ncbi:MAG: hypothetical protein ACLUNZ_13015 [Evtepia sp.]
MRNDQGTIRKALSGFYYVQTDDGLVTCRARGKFRYQKRSPPWWGTGWPSPSRTTAPVLWITFCPAAMPSSARRWRI